MSKTKVRLLSLDSKLIRLSLVCQRLNPRLSRPRRLGPLLRGLLQVLAWVEAFIGPTQSAGLCGSSSRQRDRVRLEERQVDRAALAPRGEHRFDPSLGVGDETLISREVG